MTDTYVELGFNISDYNYDNTTELLFVSGPALTSGIWSDSIGGTFFYPADVIQEAAPLFKNCDLVCEHNNNFSIGKVTNVELNDAGFSISGYINNKKSIKSIINRRKLGFSIAADIKFNPITNAVAKIQNIRNVALVATPACKICGIEHAITNEGNVIMSAKKVKTEEVVEPVEVDTSPVEESVELKEDTAAGEVGVGIETVNASTTPVPSVSIKTDSIVIEQPFDEQPLTEVMAALSAATETVTSVSDKLSAAITKIQDLEVKLSESDNKNSEFETKLKEVELKATEYKSKFEGLQRQLDDQVKTEREKLVTDITTIDPEISVDAINGMSMVQLSAYKASLDRLSNLGTRKGFKGDETAPEVDTPVEMSTSTSTEPKPLSKIDITQLVLDSLKKQKINH